MTAFPIVFVIILFICSCMKIVVASDLDSSTDPRLMSRILYKNLHWSFPELLFKGHSPIEQIKDIRSNLRRASFADLELASPSSYLVILVYEGSTTCTSGAAYGLSVGLNTCYLYSSDSSTSAQSVMYSESDSSFTQTTYSDSSCSQVLASISQDRGCQNGIDYQSSISLPSWPSDGWLTRFNIKKIFNDKF